LVYSELHAPRCQFLVQGWDLIVSVFRPVPRLVSIPFTYTPPLHHGPSEGDPKDGHLCLVSWGCIAIDRHWNSGRCRRRRFLQQNMS
jgi:hypothetical protein